MELDINKTQCKRLHKIVRICKACNQEPILQYHHRILE